MPPLAAPEAEIRTLLTATVVVALVLGVVLTIAAPKVWDLIVRRREKLADDDRAKLASHTTKLESHNVKLFELDGRVGRVEGRQDEAQRTIGRLESEDARLDGKLGGLQKHWTERFDKLEAYVTNVREELRADQRSLASELKQMLAEHRKSVHDRLNEAAAAQASLINELVDKLVERNSEPPS